MKKYNISDNFNERLHTVRVTLQDDEYKGHIAYEIGGNCVGLDILKTVDFYCMDSDDISRLKENDCNFNIDKYQRFSMILKDDQGNICGYDCMDSDEMERYIVSIEIIDCKIEEECEVEQ